MILKITITSRSSGIQEELRQRIKIYLAKEEDATRLLLRFSQFKILYKKI